MDLHYLFSMMQMKSETLGKNTKTLNTSYIHSVVFKLPNITISHTIISMYRMVEGIIY